MTFIASPYPNKMVKCENFDTGNLEHFFQQPEVTRQRRSGKKPKQPIEQYDQFLALVVDENGDIHFKSSASLRPQKTYLLKEAYHRLVAFMADMSMGEGDEGRHHLNSRALSRSATDQIILSPDTTKSSTSMPFQRPAKRHRSSTMLDAAKERCGSRDDKADIKALTAQDQKKVEISVCDTKAMHGWFCEAFKAVQQVGCRLIAKVWIKKIHPKKQSTHPYNGGYPRNEPADSNRTKPPYWPEGIKHKEPDHIDRNARTALLVHLIMHTPQPQILACSDPDKQEMISARDLLKSLEEKKGDFKAERWPIVQHIIQARTFMEQYENGEIIDPNFMICLPDYSDTSRLATGDSETDIQDADDEQLDVKLEGHCDEDDIRSGSTTLNSPRLQGINDEFSTFSNVTSSFPSIFEPPMIQQIPQQHSQCVFSSPDAHGSQSIVMLQPISDATTLESMAAIRNIRPDLLDGIIQDQSSAPQQLSLLDQQGNNAAIQSLAGNHWVPTFPPDAFIHSPYGLTTMSLEDHRDFNHSSTHMPRQHQLATVPHDLSLLDTSGCQEYGPDMQRTLPLRTMSNTHPALLVQGSHEPNEIRGSFYIA